MEYTIYDLIKFIIFVVMILIVVIGYYITYYKHEKVCSKLDGYMDYVNKRKELNHELEKYQLELKYDIKRIKAEKK